MNVDYTFEEWMNLPQAEKNQIVHHYWDPYNPAVGRKTKEKILHAFIKSIKAKPIQYGIKTFGWGDYNIFVIVKESKDRIPARFAGISVNKGIIKKQLSSKKYKVRFPYGGIFDIDISASKVIG
jgi:hypothetical protein